MINKKKIIPWLYNTHTYTHTEKKTYNILGSILQNKIFSI